MESKLACTSFVLCSIILSVVELSFTSPVQCPLSQTQCFPMMQDLGSFLSLAIRMLLIIGMNSFTTRRGYIEFMRIQDIYQRRKEKATSHLIFYTVNQINNRKVVRVLSNGSTDKNDLTMQSVLGSPLKSSHLASSRTAISSFNSSSITTSSSDQTRNANFLTVEPSYRSETRSRRPRENESHHSDSLSHSQVSQTTSANQSDRQESLSDNFSRMEDSTNEDPGMMDPDWDKDMPRGTIKVATQDGTSHMRSFRRGYTSDQDAFQFSDDNETSFTSRTNTNGGHLRKRWTNRESQVQLALETKLKEMETMPRKKYFHTPERVVEDDAVDSREIVMRNYTKWRAFIERKEIQRQKQLLGLGTSVNSGRGTTIFVKEILQQGSEQGCEKAKDTVDPGDPHPNEKDSGSDIEREDASSSESVFNTEKRPVEGNQNEDDIEEDPQIFNNEEADKGCSSSQINITMDDDLKATNVLKSSLPDARLPSLHLFKTSHKLPPIRSVIPATTREDVVTTSIDEEEEYIEELEEITSRQRPRSERLSIINSLLSKKSDLQNPGTCSSGDGEAEQMAGDQLPNRNPKLAVRLAQENIDPDSLEGRSEIYCRFVLEYPLKEAKPAAPRERDLLNPASCLAISIYMAFSWLPYLLKCGISYYGENWNCLFAYFSQGYIELVSLTLQGMLTAMVLCLHKFFF